MPVTRERCGSHQAAGCQAYPRLRERAADALAATIVQRMEEPVRAKSVDRLTLPCDLSANTRLDSLSDLIKHKANLRVTCRTCEKVSVIDARRVARYCLLKCWNSKLEGLAPRLIRSRCGAAERM